MDTKFPPEFYDVFNLSKIYSKDSLIFSGANQLIAVEFLVEI